MPDLSHLAPHEVHLLKLNRLGIVGKGSDFGKIIWTENRAVGDIWGF